MKIFFSKIINFIHTIYVLLMTFGFVLPESFLQYYLFLWPITWLHWQFNNNKCFLTQLEYRLKGEKDSPKSDKDHDYPFMRKLYFNLFNIKFSDKQIHNIIILKINIFWLIGAARYLKSKNRN